MYNIWVLTYSILQSQRLGLPYPALPGSFSRGAQDVADLTRGPGEHRTRAASATRPSEKRIPKEPGFGLRSKYVCAETDMYIYVNTYIYRHIYVCACIISIYIYISVHIEACK